MQGDRKPAISGQGGGRVQSSGQDHGCHRKATASASPVPRSLAPAGRAGASAESAEARLLPIVKGQNVGAPGGAWGWRLWVGVLLNPREWGDPEIVCGLRRGGRPVVVKAGDG